MPRVFIPPLVRDLTGGQEEIDVTADTIGEAIEQVDARFPGFRDRILRGDDIRPGLSIAIDKRVSRGTLTKRVSPDSEIHFLPAIGGG